MMRLNGNSKVTDVLVWCQEQHRNLYPVVLSDRELEHVADCIYDILTWYYNDVPLYDEFMEAVVKRDLVESFCQADDVNKKAMLLYVIFLHDILPADYREKAMTIR